MHPYPTSPALLYQPGYLPASGPVSTYQADYYLQPLIPYHGSDNSDSLIEPQPLIPYHSSDNSDSLLEPQPSTNWHTEKRHLSSRFELDQSFIGNWNEDELESSHFDDRQGSSCQALVKHQRNSNVDMISFAKWMGDHAKDYNGRAKVTDLAGRFRHNLRDFAALLYDYEELRRRPSSRHDAAVEDLYQQGHIVLVMFERTISIYQGPFTPKKDCSKKAWAKSRDTFEFMFDHDNEKLEGLLWHIVHWIAECHRGR